MSSDLIGVLIVALVAGMLVYISPIVALVVATLGFMVFAVFAIWTSPRTSKPVQRRVRKANPA